MSKINVFIVHGIGINKEDYADPFKKAIQEEFNSQINEILQSSDDFPEEINIKPIVWDDILGEKQKKLKELLQKQLVIGKLKPQNLFAKITTFILKLANQRLRSSFAAEFVGDIISYRDQDVWPQICQRITKELNNLTNESSEINLTFIAHSLGTVIVSDYIREQQKDKGRLHEKVVLTNFFTMGSPIALFSLNYAGFNMFKKPVKIEESRGKWINILDEGDPIGYSIKDLDENYQKAVSIDKKLDVGGYGVAHIRYWTDDKVHKIIGRKLAIDWVRLNNRLGGQELNKLYEEYDRNLGLNKT